MLSTVNPFFRFLFILVFFLGSNMFGIFSVDAALEKEVSSIFSSENTTSGAEYTKESTDTKEDTTKDITTSSDTSEGKTEKEIEKEHVKQDLNEYIIEAYKAQGNKIIKELDIKLQKTLPDNEKRKEAYLKIMTALELRKKKISKNETSEMKKVILNEFLSHMIDGLGKKIDELEK